MFAHGGLENEDRILTFEELRQRVPYTRQHIGRLERIGAFPKRVRLGLGRVGWSAHEVSRWIEDKKAERHAA
jgi:prophage regulatory protein